MPAKKSAPAKKSSKAGNPAHKAYETALAQLYKGQYKQAGQSLDQISKTYPEEKDLLARVHTLRRLCDEKGEAASTGSKPDGPVELYDQGILEHNRGNYERAVECFNEALKSSKDDLEKGRVRAAMAASHARSGRVKEALKQLKQSIEADEVNRFHAQRDQDFTELSSNEEFRELVKPG